MLIVVIAVRKEVVGIVVKTVFVFIGRRCVALCTAIGAVHDAKPCGIAGDDDAFRRKVEKTIRTRRRVLGVSDEHACPPAIIHLVAFVEVPDGGHLTEGTEAANMTKIFLKKLFVGIGRF